MGVGRIGALAAALGVGAAIASIPVVAAADTGPAESGSSKASSAAGPARPGPRSKPSRATSRGAVVSGSRGVPVRATAAAAPNPVGVETFSVPPRIASGGGSDSDAAEGRKSRRDGRSGADAPGTAPGPAGSASAPKVAAAAGLVPGPGGGSILSAFFGDGTAGQPNAGILIGNGFSFDAETCPGVNACNGGKGGLLAGHGGNGWNGGTGGSAGWFGTGGSGGNGIPGGDGGDGGTGGLFVGNGGHGGAGGAAITPAGPGGDGGAGGDAGMLSLLGKGGDGGTGRNGGAGGNGSYVLGAGGNGGAPGAGGAPGEAGRARLLFLFCRNGIRGLDDSLVYFLDDTTQTPNTPTGYAVIGEFSAGERAALTSGGRVVGESVALINNDGTDGYSLWPLISDLFTSTIPVPESQKDALAQKILSQVMLYPGSEFPDPAEGTPTSKGGYVFWGQDFEFNPGATSTDGAYAGVLAVMWAGDRILGDSMKIYPVPSSSLFKTLGSATQGPYDADHIINGDGSTPYLVSLGLKGLPTNPAAGSNGEWNFLSLAYANGLIDGFIGQQYNANFTGQVTPDTLAFYSADLPYALMSSFADPSQVATGGPWNSDYFGSIPFHAGVYWDGNVVPTWGQPPATNQQLKPTPVPLPTS